MGSKGCKISSSPLDVVSDTVKYVVKYAGPLCPHLSNSCQVGWHTTPFCPKHASRYNQIPEQDSPPIDAMRQLLLILVVCLVGGSVGQTMQDPWNALIGTPIEKETHHHVGRWLHTWNGTCWDDHDTTMPGTVIPHKDGAFMFRKVSQAHFVRAVLACRRIDFADEC